MRRSTRNVLGYAVPEVFWGFGWAITLDAPMVAAFGESAHAADDFVGTIWLLIGLALALPMLIAAWATQPLRRKRTVVLWGHVAGAVLMLLLALALYVFDGQGDGVRRVVYAIGVTAFFLSIGFLVPPWLSLIGDLFAPSQRTRVLGVTFVFNRVGGFAGGAYARSALTSSGDPWVGLFLLAGVLMLVGSLPYLWVGETQREPRPRARLRVYLAGLVVTLRTNKNLRWFVGADLLGVSYFVLLAHFSTAGFEAGLPESMAGTWTQFGALGFMIAAIVIAWKGDALLPRTWIALSLFLGSAGALLVAWGGATWVYSAAAVACGLCLGARMACHASEVMRLTGTGDATAAVGIAGALATAVQGLAPFAAGLILVKTANPPVFITVAAMTALAGVLMLSRGPDLSASAPDPPA